MVVPMTNVGSATKPQFLSVVSTHLLFLTEASSATSVLGAV